MHQGTAAGGHYYSFIKTPPSSTGTDGAGSWYEFNDANVRKLSDAEVADWGVAWGGGGGAGAGEGAGVSADVAADGTGGAGAGAGDNGVAAADHSAKAPRGGESPSALPSPSTATPTLAPAPTPAPALLNCVEPKVSRASAARKNAYMLMYRSEELDAGDAVVAAAAASPPAAVVEEIQANNQKLDELARLVTVKQALVELRVFVQFGVEGGFDFALDLPAEHTSLHAATAAAAEHADAQLRQFDSSLQKCANAAADGSAAAGDDVHAAPDQPSLADVVARLMKENRLRLRRRDDYTGLPSKTYGGTSVDAGCFCYRMQSIISCLVCGEPWHLLKLT